MGKNRAPKQNHFPRAKHYEAGLINIWYSALWIDWKAGINLEGKMTIYKVFCKNYKLKTGELMGMLTREKERLEGNDPGCIRVEMGQNDLWPFGE